MRTFNLIDANHFGMWSAAAESGCVGFFLQKLIDAKSTYPGKLILLWDGDSWRYEAYCAYKANRKELHADVQRLKDRWNTEKKNVARACVMLGITQMLADNYEADDLAALMCRKTKQTGDKVNLFTADRDWLQLYESQRVRWIDQKEGHIVQDAEMFEHYTKGFKSRQTFVEAKALCGDKGDNIPSVGNFGVKTAMELFSRFPNVQDAINVSLCEPYLLNGCSKRLTDFLDDVDKQTIFHRNLGLVDLNSASVPKPQNLRVIKQEVSPEDFITFNARHSIVKHDDVRDFICNFKEG